MNIKKATTIICIVLFMVVFGVIFFTMFSFDIGSDRVVKQGEENVTSELGDEFVIRYVTTNFPDYETVVDILDKSRKRIGSYILSDDYDNPNITAKIDSQNIRCYEVNEHVLIYKYNDEDFKEITRYPSYNGCTEKDKAEIIEISKTLIAKGDWKWIDFFGKFLIDAEDSDMKKTLERYSNGQFTQEELDLNKNSKIKKDKMQSLAKKIIEKK